MHTEDDRWGVFQVSMVGGQVAVVPLVTAASLPGWALKQVINLVQVNYTLWVGKGNMCGMPSALTLH